jgi:hypothetical protein
MRRRAFITLLGLRTGRFHPLQHGDRSTRFPQHYRERFSPLARLGPEPMQRHVRSWRKRTLPRFHAAGVSAATGYYLSYVWGATQSSGRFAPVIPGAARG